MTTPITEAAQQAHARHVERVAEALALFGSSYDQEEA